MRLQPDTILFRSIIIFVITDLKRCMMTLRDSLESLMMLAR